MGSESFSELETFINNGNKEVRKVAISHLSSLSMDVNCLSHFTSKTVQDFSSYFLLLKDNPVGFFFLFSFSFFFLFFFFSFFLFSFFLFSLFLFSFFPFLFSLTKQKQKQKQIKQQKKKQQQNKK